MSEIQENNRPEDESPEEMSGLSVEEVRVKKSRGHIADIFVRLIKEKPMGLLGGVLVMILFLTGIFADILAPYGYNDMVLAARLTPRLRSLFWALITWAVTC